MSPLRSLAIVVPMKPFARAKGRLAGVLDARARRTLARAMLLDVLAAARNVSDADVFVVTADASAVPLATSSGARVIREPDAHGISVALERATNVLGPCGYTRMLVVAGDVPLVTADDLVAVAQACVPGRSVAVVPDGTSDGTNALCCGLGELPFCFGPGSFRRHCDTTTRRGLSPEVLRLSGAALDIDRPEDVAALVAAVQPTRAQAFLMDASIGSRACETRLVA